MTKENILIFPLLKKSRTKGLTDENLSKDEIDKVVIHYMKQLIYHLKNHGIPMSPAFFKDYNLVHESLRSSLFRMGGFYHPIQDVVDTMNVPEEEQIEVVEETKD
jgi:hypothetical protein